MPDAEKIIIPGWTRVAVGAVAGVIIATVSTQAYLDRQYINKREHEEHEANDRREVARIDKALFEHMESTRLDAIRLATIEAQLAAIREDIRWLREHAERRRLVVP